MVAAVLEGTCCSSKPPTWKVLRFWRHLFFGFTMCWVYPAGKISGGLTKIKMPTTRNWSTITTFHSALNELGRHISTATQSQCSMNSRLTNHTQIEHTFESLIIHDINIYTSLMRRPSRAISKP
jgi:hypothetical protein